MKRVENIKIGISGVRGIVGDTLSPELVLNFTRAFATLIGKGKIAVATDSRVSGDFLKRAVFSGLVFSGITPVDVFTIPTPTLQIFVKTQKLNGGIIITASHNPEQWNGLKFIDKKGLFLSSYTASHLLDIYHQRSYILPQKNQFPTVMESRNAFDIHRKKVFSIINLPSIRKKKFKVLADPGGGASSSFDLKFLEEMGCQVTMINDSIGTYFPRKPECLPQHLSRATEMMKKGGFDIGFAQDSDGDRLIIIDERGRTLSGDYGLAFALDGFLSRKPAGKIVVNLSTSNVVEYVAEKHKFEVVKSPVGEINVVEKMMECGAVAGGEGNGGVIIPSVHFCRDSFTAMALTLENLARTGRSVSDIVKTYPAYRMVKTKIPFSMTAANRIVSLLKEEYADGIMMDGLRVNRPDYWFHIRASNTEPILRIIAESTSGAVDTIIDDLMVKINGCSKK